MKKHVKRYLSLALTFALVLAIPFAFTQEASAASKTTKYVTTSNTITYKNSDGSIGSTSTTNITYFKNGLAKTITYSDGSKTVYTRNKKGYITSGTSYDKNGKLDYAYSYKYEYNKKGLPVKQYEYDQYNKLAGTYTVSFYKNGKEKESVFTFADGNGVNSYKYNKKGDITFVKYTDKTYSSWSNYSYKYDKKGNPTKIVRTEEWVDGSDSGKATSVTTYKYKYDKKKNVKQSDSTEVYTSSDGKTRTSSRTVTYKYKKVKVAKKFLKFFR